MTTSRESQHIDRKSIRKVTGSTADFGELAQDCVCFANGAGGTLLIGIEDDCVAPPVDQRVDPGLPDRIRKRVGELTVNVQVVPELKRHENGGEYIALGIPRAAGVASTSDGRYFLRVGDTCRPIVGDDVMRLANERPATPWEEMTLQRVPRANADAAKVASICAHLRASDRVKLSVKEKTDDELLTHYDLAKGEVLTNLGVLLLGGRQNRAGLGSAPIVQAIKYDEGRLGGRARRGAGAARRWSPAPVARAAPVLGARRAVGPHEGHALLRAPRAPARSWPRRADNAHPGSAAPTAGAHPGGPRAVSGLVQGRHLEAGGARNPGANLPTRARRPRRVGSGGGDRRDEGPQVPAQARCFWPRCL